MIPELGQVALALALCLAIAQATLGSKIRVRTVDDRKVAPDRVPSEMSRICPWEEVGSGRNRE